MDTRTGELVREEDILESEKRNFVKVVRDVTEIEKSNKQILLYSPCACGSGKKFKFCCFKSK